jgi:hypothetical protein
MAIRLNRDKNKKKLLFLKKVTKRLDSKEKKLYLCSVITNKQKGGQYGKD